MSDGHNATATKSGAPDPLIGRVIADRFKITSLIARGGMGKVYKAEQAPLGRACAVKVLNPNYNGDADPEFHRRFFREASITSRITHPNSVTIFDYGKTDDEIYFMAMEYLEGQTLHQALREGGTMHEERVGRIAAQICRALREAHALDVIHRDLKPANIFLSRHGDDEDFVKVLDFGLVKHLSERPEEQLTQTGLFMGSPKYMAPEQIQGGHVDPRTDIYSLGIIMYEMLAGKVPFDRPTSVNILMAHVGEPPPPMREVNPNLICSPVFEDLVMTCISKNPEERFRTMDEVLSAIKRAHNVSMTGQLAAVNASGAYGLIGSQPPPAVRSSNSRMAISSGSHRPLSTTSGSHTPMGVLASVDGAIDPSGSGFVDPPRRSKAWIGLGVLVAAAVGGLLGMVAFRMTAEGGALPTVAPAVTSAAPQPSASTTTSATVASSTPSASTSAAPAAGGAAVTMKITSDPPGASIHEGTTELCPSTPCEITLKPETADASRAHKLTFDKRGFKPETVTVKAGEAPPHVKLARGVGAVGPTIRQSPPTQTTPPKPPPDSTTPSGFKDLPY